MSRKVLLVAVVLLLVLALPAFAQQAGRAGVIFYPFFLDGVALDPKLNQSDGIHPTPAGASVIAQRLLPVTERLIAAVEMRRKAAQK